MRVLIGYESVMGNTRQVAEAIAAGARRSAPGALVQCVRVGYLALEPPDVDLLILGGPTHFFGLPAERTRRMWIRGVVEASRRGAPAGHQLLEPGALGPGVREWLAGLPEAALPLGADLLDGVLRTARSPRRPAAAFDTRLGRRLAGGAARRIARSLRRHGFTLIAPPEGFIVDDMPGPLRPGEADRAEIWGARLTSLLTPAAAH